MCYVVSSSERFLQTRSVSSVLDKITEAEEEEQTMSALFKNTNVEEVLSRQKQKRDQAREDAQKKKEGDKMQREKDKLAKQDRKEKEKKRTQKVITVLQCHLESRPQGCAHLPCGSSKVLQCNDQQQGVYETEVSQDRQRLRERNIQGLKAADSLADILSPTSMPGTPLPQGSVDLELKLEELMGTLEYLLGSFTGYMKGMSESLGIAMEGNATLFPPPIFTLA
ncbi:hypothetical protein FQN60_004034 [Etheostoma spectabile]|uniref:Uncharacterized protein n=1 Tax=Etheostoma spectabile TaxID=54343 RepID=A0A5J5CXM9_9PERO|nr:hypothetical protein FQN60_004034 [Etheostoma spectabile]